MCATVQKEFKLSYKAGLRNSTASGAQTPRTKRCPRLMKASPFPLIVPIIIYEFRYKSFDQFIKMNQWLK